MLLFILYPPNLINLLPLERIQVNQTLNTFPQTTIFNLVNLLPNQIIIHFLPILIDIINKLQIVEFQGNHADAEKIG